MQSTDEPGPRAVLRMLRGCERRATELSRTQGGFDPVTYTEQLGDGDLTVTISAESGQVTVAFYDPEGGQTLVLTLEQLRRRIAEL